MNDIRGQAQFRLLYPPGYESGKEQRMKDFGFVRTLKIRDMVVLLRESYHGFADLNLEDFFSTDPDVLDYRLSVVEDLVENPALYKAFCESVNMIYNINDLQRLLRVDYSVDSSLGSARYLEMYLEIVDLFAGAFGNCELRSAGMQQLKDLIRAITESEEYRNLCRELPKMRTDFGYLKSVTIGVNLDSNLYPKEAGIVSVNGSEYKPGSVMDRLLRRKDDGDGMHLMSSLYPLTKGLPEEQLTRLNYAVSNSLHKIYTRSLRDFEPLIQNYFKVNSMFFISLLDDIRFLTAGVKFILDMREKGCPMCRPRPVPMAEKRCDLDKLYHPLLVWREEIGHIVPNSFHMDENGRFFIVTGPNCGGKSLFAQAVGIAQALFQLGLFVPAESAVMSPVSGIYTHFPSYDEQYKNSGLEGECMRLSEILRKLTDTDMILLDETFSSTSGLEAGYIASEVLTGIGVIGCCGMFVTHLHELLLKIGEFNSHPDNKARIDNLVAQMGDKEHGERSYQISRTTPDGLSYAKDIAGRYGLDLEGILNRNAGE